MYCSMCGILLPDDSNFCHNCGCATAAVNFAQTANINPYIETAAPVVTSRPAAEKFNIFPFISAAISLTTMIVAFLPWFTLDNDAYNIYKMLDYNFMLEYYGVGDFSICAVLMFICMALFIPSVILYLVKKHNAPLIFPILTAAIILLSLLIFVYVMPSYSYVLKSTPVPIILLILSVANIVFAILARKK